MAQSIMVFEVGEENFVKQVPQSEEEFLLSGNLFVSLIQSRERSMFHCLSSLISIQEQGSGREEKPGELSLSSSLS